MDSNEKIASALLGDSINKYLKGLIKNNETMEFIFRKAGLSSIYNEYSTYFNPFRYNKGYENPNNNFNPGYGLMNVIDYLIENKTSYSLLLKYLFKEIWVSQDEKVDFEINLKNNLNILGYDLILKETRDFNRYCDKEYNYETLPFTPLGIREVDDLSTLEKMLKNTHPDIYISYKEAIANYITGSYISCIDCCRSIIEKFFSKLGCSYFDGFIIATNESTTPPIKQTLKSIFTNWIDTKKGYNRTRLFTSYYSIASGLGTHKEEIPSKQDALMLFQMMQDILLWCLQNNIGF